MNLTQALHRGAQQHPAKSAVVCEGRRLSFDQWKRWSETVAATLQVHGVVRGDRVALLGTNSERYAVGLTGVWWIGAIACPINTRWSVAEIAMSLRDCDARVVLVDGELATMVPSIQELAPGVSRVLRLDHVLEGRAATHSVEDARTGGSHPAVLLYTGGTTGTPKGVVLSHENLMSSALARLAATPRLADSVALLSTPMFHVASIARMLPHMIAGGTCVVVPQFRAPNVLATIEREGVTDLALVPSMLQTLLDEPTFEAARLRSVQRIGYGAAPITEALLARAMDTLPKIEFSQSYGMTECSALATLSLPSDHLPEARHSGRSRSAGRAITIAELRIVGARGEALEAGEIGEITVRGPHVMTGYWNRPEETAHALRDGWLFTGDAGRIDHDGYLYVVDRIKDMIVTGGENVYSAEVENVLSAHPAVRTCAVFAVPSREWGEAVHAVVVLEEAHATDASTLLAYLRAHLAGYKCPKKIELVASLPLTAAGKVAKNELREPYWRGESRRVS